MSEDRDVSDPFVGDDPDWTDAGDGRAAPPSDDASSGGPADGPADDASDLGTDVGAVAGSESDAPVDAPLGDLATAVREREDRGDGELDDLFEERDVTEIDADAVWERLEADEPATGDHGATEERVVEKASYCETCPYFSAPPAVHCTHEGTSILELVDVDHFRVVNCPKVRETERLEEL